ncbi:type II toxin-antitoxin system RelE/ParE family toxin [Sulfuricurvum sp. RIFCSPLOWO2_12_FULL_43_24]|uniref:type II toxin-antitoxin system RelE family toxin n=1 Tax=Sulfuricurvum sp. RIFCSPLOWO2_12_FULL_43_24 TaxID=1802247 RepID=UPI0008B3323F|nr:type II toxin-antitoxin system RelE/ParE family toxin [Sulfuricurvum sp. RIFCSPLOWO2_12_FULL_43_24]OHD84005.1 MAG: plasmid stabilization protein [Sulfuricurvum sp. RIFCSPLOWO2_02_43_6]OHD89321.1 MAG: plasmid stabilization protein [Sulfuricurvum sp. RIFCSPHIGHO2_12_FULL_44_8]OHD89596.1 MAG: plasmid stabilization protein [Sulfuricurvum sp. RIFCSPLOWO2_12_FULL_43_24]
MRLEIKKQFLKDIENVPKNIKIEIVHIIELLETSASLQELSNLKKLKGYNNYYRIRIGQYRMGIALVDDAVVLSRFLHRKEVYRFFP